MSVAKTIISLVSGLFGVTAATDTPSGAGGTLSSSDAAKIPLLDANGGIPPGFIYQQLRLSLITSSASGSTDLNDYALTSSHLLLSPSANINLTGMAGLDSSQAVVITNLASTFAVTVKNNSTASANNNRFMLPGGTDIALNPGDSITVAQAQFGIHYFWFPITTVGAGSGSSSPVTTSANGLMISTDYCAMLLLEHAAFGGI